MRITKSVVAIQLSKKLISMNRWLKVALMLAADGMAFPFCFLIAMLLRLGDFGSMIRYGITPHITIALITIAFFAISGLYRAVIRFIDHRLLISIGIGFAVVADVTYSVTYT
jgi:FlaA1/EpsC-like NDP-sugar epimerase